MTPVKLDKSLTSCLQGNSQFCIVEGGIADIRVATWTG